MNDRGWSLFRKGLARRRKEVRWLRSMMALAVFLTAFVLLFQDNINEYVMQNNYRDYGRWLFRVDEGEELQSPYLLWDSVYVGGEIQRLKALTEDVIEIGDSGEPAPKSVLSEFDPENPAEQLVIPEKENSRQTGLKIGALSESFAGENYIGLYEGRLPEAPDEIAMELNALQELGLSYELGQKVSFYIAEPVDHSGAGADEDVMLTLNLFSFTLCGTLDRYTGRWNGGSDLANALISEDAYHGIVMDKKAYFFGKLRPEYSGNDVWIFAEELIAETTGETEEQAPAEDQRNLIANRGAYYNPFWGDPTLYRNMIVVLLVLSVCLVAYLMTAYLSKRRKFFLRLREIGASTGEVWKMAAYECVLGVLPAATAALVIAYAVSLIAVWIMTVIGHAEWFYIFSWKTLILILMCILATLGLSLLAALLAFSGRGISEKRRSLSKSVTRRLRRRSLKSKCLFLSYRETLLRERRSHRLATWSRRLAVIIVCAILLYCTDMTAGSKLPQFTPFSGWVHVNVRRTYKVPQGPKTQKYEITEGRGMMSKTIPEAFFDELQEKPGVSGVIRGLSDAFREISWEGKEEDPEWARYMNAMVMDALENIGYLRNYNADVPAAKAFLKQYEQSLFAIEAFENGETVWEETGQKPSDPYYEAFMKGEAVCLEINNSLFPEGEASELFREGDELEIFGKNGSIRVTVASVKEGQSVLGKCTIRGSAELAKHLQELDDASGCWNSFVVNFDELSDRENTAKALAELCVRYGVTYLSMAEILQEMEEQHIRNIVTYGFFGLALFMLFFCMSLSVSAERNQHLAGKRDLLRKMGAEGKVFARERKREAVREALWGLAALPIVLAVHIFITYRGLTERSDAGGAFYSNLLQRIVSYGPGGEDSWLLTAVISTLENRNWLPTGIALLLLILLITFAYRGTGKGENDD